MPDVLVETNDALSTENVARMRTLVRRHLDQGGDIEALPLATAKAPENLRHVRLSRTEKPKNWLDRERYRCPFCGHDDKFWEGWVLLCSDGQLRLIGSDCARHHLGIGEWEVSGADFDAARRAEQFQSVKKIALPLISSLIQEIERESARCAESIYEAGRFPTDFGHRMPELYLAIEIAISDRGQLQVDRRVVDVAAIERSRQSQSTPRDEAGTSPDPTRLERVTMHTLRGTRAIEFSQIPNALVRNASTRLNAANRAFDELTLDTQSLRQFDSAFRSISADVRRAIELLRAAIEQMSALPQFLEASNTVRICVWANDPDNRLSKVAKFNAVAGGIWMSSFDGRSERITLPAKYDVPKFPSLEHLARAMK